MPSRLVNIAIQTVSIVIFALISAIAPGYMWIFFILYIVLIMYITTRLVAGGLKKATGIKGSPLFKEDNAHIVMASDALLFQELKDQFRNMMIIMLLPLLVILVAPPLYWQYVSPYINELARSFTTNDVLIKFVVNLGFYATLVLLIQLPRLLLTLKAKQRKQIFSARTFSVYRDGVVLDGRLLKFEKDMCYQANIQRRFVQISSPRLSFDIRLYTIETAKLIDVLRRVGLDECKA